MCIYKTAWTPVIGQMLDVQAESHLSLLETAASATRMREINGNAPLSRILSISRMLQISSKFLDKKCDLYSGKYGKYDSIFHHNHEGMGKLCNYLDASLHQVYTTSQWDKVVDTLQTLP